MKTKKEKNPTQEIQDQLKRVLGDEFKDNRFICSKSFIDLVTMFAAMPRLLMTACSNAAEATNVVMSVMITFVKNIPDPLFHLMKATVEKDKGKNTEVFKAIEALRNYQGDKFVEWRADDTPKTDDIPEFTATPPTRAQ